MSKQEEVKEEELPSVESKRVFIKEQISELNKKNNELTLQMKSVLGDGQYEREEAIYPAATHLFMVRIQKQRLNEMWWQTASLGEVPSF